MDSLICDEGPTDAHDRKEHDSENEAHENGAHVRYRDPTLAGGRGREPREVGIGIHGVGEVDHAGYDGNAGETEDEAENPGEKVMPGSRFGGREIPRFGRVDFQQNRPSRSGIYDIHILSSFLVFRCSLFVPHRKDIKRRFYYRCDSGIRAFVPLMSSKD